jgi:hypothetical protein
MEEIIPKGSATLKQFQLRNVISALETRLQLRGVFYKNGLSCLKIARDKQYITFYFILKIF